jgi:hypothetical protein
LKAISSANKKDWQKGLAGTNHERGSTIAWFVSPCVEVNQAMVGSLFPFWTPFSEAVLRLRIRPECLIQANEDEAPPVHSHSCRTGVSPHF